MKKNIVQDVVPPKRTIRNIELPSRSKKLTSGISDIKPKSQPIIKKVSTPKIDIIKPKKVEIEEKNNFEYVDEGVSQKSGYKKYLVSATLLFALFFLISSFFRSAEITFLPKQETRVLNETFTAEKNIASGGLGFQIVTTTKDIEKDIPATGEERVDKKASGTLVIYNTTTEAQRLVATTRFEATGGLIYRAKTPVVVPARIVKDGKNVAGMAEVVVEADSVGEKYNIPLSDFSIVGFKGTPKYTQIYARGKTPMTGGFSGMQKIVSKEELEKANSELERSLREQLSLDIATQIPSNFVLYKKGFYYDFEQLTQIENSSDSALVKKRGTVSAIIFDRSTLSKYILQKILPNYEQDSVKIANLDLLEFNLNTINFDPNNTNSISFSLKGDANIVWVFDEDKIKTDLLGLSKSSAEEVLAKYINMKEVWIKTSPFWSKKIPNNPDKVQIVNTLRK